MSFDLFLEHFQLGKPSQSCKVDVLDVVRQFCKTPADDFGFYYIDFADGSHVELSAKGLESGRRFTGGVFYIRGMSPEIVLFVFAFAVAGDMIIFNAQGEDTLFSPLAILTSESQRIHLPQGAAINPVLCESAHHLAKLLGVGFEKWSAYRDNATTDKNTS